MPQFVKECRGHSPSNCIVQLRLIFDLATKKLVILIDELVTNRERAGLRIIVRIRFVAILKWDSEVPWQGDFVIQIGNNLRKHLRIAGDRTSRIGGLARLI